MVNVIDNGARNRTNMIPVGIKVIDDKGDVAYTAKTDLGTNYISLESKWFDSSSNNTGGSSTGGSTGGNAGGATGGTTGGGGSVQNPVSQLPSTVNLFSGSAVGNILLSGPSANYDNVQDGLLITLGNITSGGHYHNVKEQSWLPDGYEKLRLNLSSIGLKGIKIPKEKLVVNSSFDISDQLSQYVGKAVKAQYATDESNNWTNTGEPPETLEITSFGGTTVGVLPNTTISINLTVKINDLYEDEFSIPVIQVNDYKN